MFFFISKLLWILFNPFNLIFFLIVICFIVCYFFSKKILTIFIVILSIVFTFVAVFPTGQFFLQILERPFYDNNILPEKVDGIIILSGAENSLLTSEHNKIILNDSSERLIDSLYLIKKYPEAKIIFSGCSGSLKYTNFCGSDVAKIFYKKYYFNSNKIIYENKSRNTYENILFSKELAEPQKNENWILVTSAFHISRSINVASQLDWTLIPYATDFRVSKKINWIPSFGFLGNINMFQQASHEWIGLFVYYIVGKSAKIF